MKKLFGALFALSFWFCSAAIAERKIEVLVTSWCPYCKALERFLQAGDIEYKRLDVEHDSQGIKRYEALGAGGVPIVIINGKVLRGFDKELLKQLLRDTDSETERRQQVTLLGLPSHP